MNKPYVETLWASSDVVKEHKANYLRWATTTMAEECDPLWLPHMETLNVHESMVTQYCCSGHPDESDDQLNVMFIVDQHGWALLQQIFARFVMGLGLDVAFDRRVSLMYWPSPEPHIPRWLMEARVNSLEDQELIINTFMSVYREIILQSLPHFHPARSQSCPLN